MTPTDRPPVSLPRSPSTPCEESIDTGGPTPWTLRLVDDAHPELGWIVHPADRPWLGIFAPTFDEATDVALTPPGYIEQVLRSTPMTRRDTARGFALREDGRGINTRWVVVCGCRWESKAYAWHQSAVMVGHAHVRDVHGRVPPKRAEADS